MQNFRRIEHLTKEQSLQCLLREKKFEIPTTLNFKQVPATVDENPIISQNLKSTDLSVPTTGTPSTMMTESTPSDSLGFSFMMSGINSLTQSVKPKLQLHLGDKPEKR
jgi:hypothetical protein